MRTRTKGWALVCAVLTGLCLLEGALLARVWPRARGDLYQNAVRDAAFADADEILPLVSLTRDDSRVTWDAAGEKALFLTWHAGAQAFPEGARTVCEVWAFTDGEMRAWYQKNRAGVKDWTLRLEQLIGLSENSGYTHVSALWARPEDVIRPAYVWDPRAPMRLETPPAGDDAFSAWYRGWFRENTLFSYFDSAYPWTRLGYTYDWAEGGGEYGLTEFLILPNAPVDVAFTYTTQEFLAWLGAEAGG